MHVLKDCCFRRDKIVDMNCEPASVMIMRTGGREAPNPKLCAVIKLRIDALTPYTLTIPHVSSVHHQECVVHTLHMTFEEEYTVLFPSLDVPTDP